MRWVSHQLAVRWLLLAAAFVAFAAAGAGQPDPGKDKGKGPQGDVSEKAAHELQHAYDNLAEVSGGCGRLPKDTERLLDASKDIYRQAHKAYKDGDFARANELAHAAKDGADGLKHLLRADTPAPEGLPPPPVAEAGPAPAKPAGDKAAPPGTPAGDRPGAPSKAPGDKSPAGDDRPARGPWTPALAALSDARDHIKAAGDNSPAKGPARDFHDAARKVYDQARQAYSDGDYAKAGELAHAADSWGKACEHLRNAAGTEARANTPPAPDTGRSRDAGRTPPPLDAPGKRDAGGGAPPPPPPLDRE
jgi:TolA-binding protein